MKNRSFQGLDSQGVKNKNRLSSNLPDKFEEDTISGYKIRKIIHEGSVSKVLKAFDTVKQRPVIIKILNPDELTPVQVTRFRQDFEVRKHIDSDSVAKAYNLSFYNHRPYIVMEDFGAVCLNSYMGTTPLGIKDFLHIARKSIQILDIIHKKDVIHKDIKPCNILYNQDTDEVKFTDFGISTLLSYEHPALLNPRSLEGTIAFISPEQTGRMNRFLDYRTDYYSLGITFYYLLTGTIPFNEPSSMGMVHSHIAKRPAPVTVIDENIPVVLSNIIMKLLEKNPEDRYQSAAGILHDIKRCQKELKSRGKIELFLPGKGDISDKFHIPEKLYGRKKEVEALKEAFFRIQGGNTEILMVNGYSGSGKTALVNELKKEVSGTSTFFISGKFEQLNKKEAYSGIIQAFENLIFEILSETDETIILWRDAISSALGENGKILTDLIPRLELIVGKQPRPRDIGVTEARNRFNYTFKEFVKVFAKSGKPLVLFLDDMHWIDSASLGLLRSLIINNEIENCLLIGSYRSNEVDSSHPLFMFLRDAKSEFIPITEIETQPLSFNDTLELVKDTLLADESKTYKLVNLIYKKTGANPFFVKEFLKSLHREKLLFFNDENKTWQWKFDEIETKSITDNVLELIIKRIQKLPEKTLHILKIASCLGNRFSFNKLLSVTGLEDTEFFKFLWKAIKEGMIIPVGENSSRLRNPFPGNDTKQALTSDLVFQHDKVQQAAYSMIDKEKIPFFHLSIGRTILLDSHENNFDKNLFEIVNQLNLGAELIKDNGEKRELALLNLKAGKKTKSASAYKRSLEYLLKSYSLIFEDLKEKNTPETKIIIRELAEVRYLCGDFKEAEVLLEKLIEKIDDNIEKCEVYELLILVQTMSASYEEAVLTGHKALKLLNVNLPLKNTEKETSIEVDIAIKSLLRTNIAALVNEPEMEDIRVKTAMKILIRLQATSYFFKNELYPFILAKMTNFSIEYGNTAESAKGYGSFANIFANKTEDYKTAYEIGKTGLNISKKFKNKKIECQTRLSLSAFLIHGVTHLRDGDENIRKGYQAGLESGEIQYAGLILFNKVLNRFFQGVPLHRLEEEVPHELSFCVKTGNNIGIDVITPFNLAVFNLRNKTESDFDFSDDVMGSTKYFNKFYNNKSWFGIFLLRLLKAQSFYIYGHFQEAYNELVKAKPFIESSLGYFSEVEFHFTHAITVAALYDDADESNKIKYKASVRDICFWLKKRAAHAPENYLPRYLIVAAELARLENDFHKAVDLYDEAIDACDKFDYIQLQAIANEICARAWKKRNKHRLARPYLEDALTCYRGWGALRKVKCLEKLITKSSTYLFNKGINNFNSTTSPGMSDSDMDYSTSLDMESVAQTSQAISIEVDLEKLLKKLMKIMIESAGAGKGFIILKKPDGLKIEAAARTEPKRITVLESIPLDQYLNLAESVVRYVIHTGEDVVINDVSKTQLFSKDPWLQKKEVRSVLCTPVRYKDKTTGVLYLENSLSTNVFSRDRLNILKNLLPQAAISIDNALLFAESAKLTKNLEKEIEYRKKIQAELEKKERKYREIFENTRDIYIETNIDGTILEASPSVVESSLFTREELIGERIDNKYISERDKKLLIKSLMKDGKVHNFEALCKTREGEDVYASINAMLEKNEEGDPEKIIVSMRDITEKKQLELRLFHSQKMEAIGTLAGGIAHDFNNILAGISGYTDIALLKFNKEPDKIPHYLNGISKASLRAKHLVSQILSFSRSSEKDKKKINPLPVIKEALKLLRSSIPSSIEMVQNIEADVVSIMGNTTQIHQVIMNLCTNAAHAMKSHGGVLSVKIKEVNVDSQIIETIEGSVPEGSYILLSVEDSGHGIPDEIKNKIFDPYFTTKRVGEGTGLGLSMVQGIVQNHNGYISLISAKDVGTKFHIYLPLLMDKSEFSDEKRYCSPEKGTEKVLFVDDEELLVEIMKDMLEDCGYQVTATTSPVEALNLFNDFPQNFDIVISDMTMPVITGDKLAEEILRIRPDIPVIICTGYSESVTDSKIKNIGIKKRLIKPFNLEELSTTIRDILDKKEGNTD